MNETKPTPIVFCDLETTGLVPGEHDILEVAMLAVVDFRPVAEFEAVVRPAQWFDDGYAPRTAMHPRVVEMHSNSGLLRAVAADDALPPEAAEAVAHAFLDEHVGLDRPLLCGFNPDFDRRFLEWHWPRLAKRFHYRSLDCNSYWLLRQLVTGETGRDAKAQTQHRALADCKQALAAVIEHFDWMFQLAERAR